MKKTLPYCLLIICLLVVIACRENQDDTQKDSFDRTEMLHFWADEIIIPSYEIYVEQVLQLQTTMDAFIVVQDMTSLTNLREAWKTAYFGWQRVSMFDIGPAESISLRNFTNIYPTNVTLINEHISQGNYNLELPSTFTSQGFPALDYLLYGVEESDEELLNFYTDELAKAYLKKLIDRMSTLSSEVLQTWKTDYKQTFIAQDGSSATASVDKLVNDYIFHYEKFLRAGKVGIPAGVFSGAVLTSHVEAPFSTKLNKQFFTESLDASRSFFYGESQRDATDGNSLADYVVHVREMNDGEDLVSRLDQHWKNIDNILVNLDDDFASQIEADNNKMLELYDEIQKTVILLKVDMLQALNIQVDYVDADGD